MDLGITGKTILITGATGGLGKAAAGRLSEAGARLVLTDIDQEKLDEMAADYDATIVATSADLTSDEGIQSLRTAMGKDVSPDAIVHHAGITGAKGDPLEVSDDDFEECWQTNFMSAVRLSRAFIPEMAAKGWGRVVFTTSENAVQPYVDETVYNTSKAALLSFMKSTSLVYGPKGVRVNAVAPAFVESPMTDKMMKQRAEDRGESFDEAIESFLEEERPYLTLKRRGKPDEVAAVVAFLVSDLASFVNGAAYRVDGGAVASINT